MENETGFDSFRAWSSMAVVIMGTFLAMISATTINVALPTIMSVFGSTLSGVQWVITAYAMTMAITVPLAPYLSRVFSSERVYLSAMVVFVSFSALCAFSWSLNAMLFFRIMQAVGGGLMQPIGMGMVLFLFPVEKRGLAFGVFGIAAMSAPAFGPTLGGYIVQFLGWRYIFLINLPFGIIAVLMALKFFKFSQRIPFPKFDFSGFISAAVASSLILYLLGKNQEIDWHDPHYVYMLIIGIGAFIYFIANELYSDSPLLDLRMLKNRNFSLSLVLTVTQSLMMMSGAFIMPVFLQNLKGLTAMRSGEMLLPASLVMAFMMPIAGKLTDIGGEKGTKWIIMAGFPICGASTLKLSALMNINASIGAIVVILAIRSIGLGLSMMPARTIGLAEIAPSDSQKAMAMSAFILQFSSSLAVAFITLMISARFNAGYAFATSQLTAFNIPFNEALRNLTAIFVSRGMSVTDSTSQALISILQIISMENYALAFEYTVLVTAIIGISSLFIVPLFKTKRKPLAADVKT